MNTYRGAESDGPGGPLRRYLPILAWAPKYPRTWLPADGIAGLSVWALLVPQSLARLPLSSAVIAFILTASAGLKSMPLTILAIVISYLLVDRLFHPREQKTTSTKEAASHGATNPSS